MLKKKSNILLVATLLVVSGLFLSGCGEDDSDKSSDSSNTESNECYAQCDEWGGDDATVQACKDNCDASNDEDSVWNDEDSSDDNDATFDSWEGMPLAVPEFMYGDFVAGEEGMGSWIVDYENVTDDNALSDYVDELETYDWTASYMSVTSMITGSKEGYSITVSMDKDYDTVQIIVRESN